MATGTEDRLDDRRRQFEGGREGQLPQVICSSLVRFEGTTWNRRAKNRQVEMGSDWTETVGVLAVKLRFEQNQAMDTVNFS